MTDVLSSVFRSMLNDPQRYTLHPKVWGLIYLG